MGREDEKRRTEFPQPGTPPFLHRRADTAAPLGDAMKGKQVFPMGTNHIPFYRVRRNVTGLYPGVPDDTLARCAIVRGHCPLQFIDNRHQQNPGMQKFPPLPTMMQM